MLDCRNIADRATDYMERRLNLWERLQFKMHILICGPCELYLRQMGKIVEMLGRFPREAPSAATKTMLLETFRSAHCQKERSPHQ
jgi:hypothetical protein